MSKQGAGGLTPAQRRALEALGDGTMEVTEFGDRVWMVMFSKRDWTEGPRVTRATFRALLNHKYIKLVKRERMTATYRMTEAGRKALERVPEPAPESEGQA